MNSYSIDDIQKCLRQTPDIHERRKFFNSAVILPFIRIKGEYHILFEKRSRHIKQGGEICFPGGRFSPELDKTYQDTALRETYEELGISSKNIEIIGRLDTVVARMGSIIEVFVGEISLPSIDNIAFSEDEVENIFTIPLSFFLNNSPSVYQVRMEVQPSFIDSNGEKIILLPSKELGLPERYHTPWGGQIYDVYVYQTQHGVLWGITASILQGFLDLFQNRSKIFPTPI